MTIALALQLVGSTVHDPGGRQGTLIRLDHSTGKPVAVLRLKCGREKRCLLAYLYRGKSSLRRIDR